MSACPDCGDDDCDLVGCAPSPGDDRRAWLREQAQEQPED